MSCIWRFLYRDVIVPGDTFPMMMRKMIMALSVIAGNIGLLNLLTTAPPTNETHAIYFYDHIDRFMDLREMDPHGTHLADCGLD